MEYFSMKHENVNCSSRFRAELIKIVMRAEHENVNCGSHFRAELIITQNSDAC